MHQFYYFAEVAQSIEHQPSKLRVAGLSPVFRSFNHSKKAASKLVAFLLAKQIPCRASRQVQTHTRFHARKIFSQLIALAMPLMAVSFIQMTYNLVDIMWIGRLGSKSVAAVGQSV